MSMLDAQVSRRLASSRIMAGLTRRELAGKLDVSYRTIERAEAEGYTRRVLVWAWAAACGVDREWLEYGTGEPNYKSEGWEFESLRAHNSQAA